MGRREDVDNGIWHDPDFRDLSAPAKLLYLWSFTNPSCNMAGVFKTGAQSMAQDTGLTPRAVERGIEELVERGYWVYRRPWLWVRSRVKYLGSRNPNIAKAIVRDVGQVDDGELRDLFTAAYGTHEQLVEAFRGFRSTNGKRETVSEGFANGS